MQIIGFLLASRLNFLIIVMLFGFFYRQWQLIHDNPSPGSWGVFACIHFCSMGLCLGLQSTYFISCWKQVEQQKCLRCVDGGHATKRYSEDCHCQNKLLVKCLCWLLLSLSSFALFKNILQFLSVLPGIHPLPTFMEMPVSLLSFPWKNRRQ